MAATSVPIPLNAELYGTVLSIPHIDLYDMSGWGHLLRKANEPTVTEYESDVWYGQLTSVPNPKLCLISYVFYLTAVCITLVTDEKG